MGWSPALSVSAVLGTFAVIFFLSPWGFQLSTFHAGWGSFVVIFFLSLRGFQLPTFHAGWFSTANLSCWLVLIHFLSPWRFQLPFFSFTSTFLLKSFSPQGFQLPFFCVHGYFSADCSLASPSSAVSAVSLYLHVVAE